MSLFADASLHPSLPASLIVAAVLYREMIGMPAQAANLRLDFPLLPPGSRMGENLPLERNDALNALARPVNHNPAILLQTQDLPPIYEENSCVYIFSRATLEARRNRLGERPLMFEIPRGEAWDIDEELDFLVADLVLRHRMGNPLPASPKK